MQRGHLCSELYSLLRHQARSVRTPENVRKMQREKEAHARKSIDRCRRATVLGSLKCTQERTHAPLLHLHASWKSFVFALPKASKANCIISLPNALSIRASSLLKNWKGECLILHADEYRIEKLCCTRTYPDAAVRDLAEILSIQTVTTTTTPGA